MRNLVVAWLLVVSIPAVLHADGEEPTLVLARDGAPVARLGLTELIERCGEERVEVDDPYYGRPMTFRAVPLPCVLLAGYGGDRASLAREDFSLIALDGYTRPSAGSLFVADEAHLAFADASLSAPGSPLRFEPITRRRLDPAPFYLVWSGEGRSDTHRYPWPFQLATIDRVPFERRHPHTAPAGAPADAAAWRGYQLFRSECVMCHSVNGEGGRVGPELNVPRSIVEYRRPEQIKAYVRDPESFRYTTMPSHEHLTDADLDALVAYFEAMSHRKHDARAASSDGR